MDLKVVAVIVLALIAAGCAGDEPPSEDGAKTQVVAAFFPVAEAAERIGGARIDVINLTPARVEPHDLELSTEALDRVLDADLVLYLKGFQPALDEVAPKPSGVDLLDDRGASDPHIWLDPVLWGRAVSKVADALSDVDPGGEASYRKRASAYLGRLGSLDRSFENGLTTCDRDLIVTAHDAFGYLTKRYGLRSRSIAGISPEAEPDPKHLAELADLVKREGITTIFTEELVSPKVAEVLAREANVQTDVLDPIESEPEGGYIAGMNENLKTLRRALGCT